MDYRRFKKTGEIFIALFLAALVILLAILLVLRDRATQAEAYAMAEYGQMPTDMESISGVAQQFDEQQFSDNDKERIDVQQFADDDTEGTDEQQFSVDDTQSSDEQYLPGGDPITDDERYLPCGDSFDNDERRMPIEQATTEENQTISGDEGGAPVKQVFTDKEHESESIDTAYSEGHDITDELILTDEEQRIADALIYILHRLMDAEYQEHPEVYAFENAVAEISYVQGYNWSYGNDRPNPSLLEIAPEGITCLLLIPEDTGVFPIYPLYYVYNIGKTADGSFYKYDCDFCIENRGPEEFFKYRYQYQPLDEYLHEFKFYVPVRPPTEMAE